MLGNSGRPRYPHVHQINVSDGGVPKQPVLEAKITKEGVAGDRQRNLKVHGGPNRALCIYSLDLLERLQDEGHSIDSGSSGENLTLAGVDWEILRPGVQLSIGPEVQLELTSYCAPCDLIARWFRDGEFSRISQEQNPGWSRLYSKIIRPGVVRPGDEVTIRTARGRARQA